MDATVDRYLHQLATTRGASEHTLRAYGGDLAELAAYLESHSITDLRCVDGRCLRGYLAWLDERELAPSTIQRKLSAVRALFRYLLREGEIEKHPATGLRKRRTTRHLPGCLEESEVEALLAAPDEKTALGRRNRALLEVMYSAGTRAAETLGLDRADLDLRQGIARVKGKGRKQRLAPLGSHALKALRAYLSDPERPRPSRRNPDAVFLNARGGG